MSSAHQALMMAGAEPPKVYATLDPANKGAICALSGGNLIATPTAGGGWSARSTISKSSGKWYWEVTVGVGSNYFDAAATANSYSNVNVRPGSGITSNSKSYDSTGAKFYNNVNSITFGAAYATGDVMGVALDAATGNVTCYKNNVLQGTMTDSFSGPYFAAVGGNVNGNVLTVNFGATTMAYTAPSGYNQGLYNE